MGMAMASLNISGKVLAPTITALEYAVLELGLSFAQAPRCLSLEPVGRGSSDAHPRSSEFPLELLPSIHTQEVTELMQLNEPLKENNPISSVHSFCQASAFLCQLLGTPVL